jgi:hypothetical protein
MEHTAKAATERRRRRERREETERYVRERRLLYREDKRYDR